MPKLQGTIVGRLACHIQEAITKFPTVNGEYVKTEESLQLWERHLKSLIMKDDTCPFLWEDVENDPIVESLIEYYTT